jgi:hypothetical protein
MHNRKVLGVSLETWMSLFTTNIHVCRYIQWNMKYVVLYFSAVLSGPLRGYTLRLTDK